MDPILEFININKAFPGVKALENVCMNLYPGEVHVIAGENGAGKSTLMKVLSGVYSPDSGEILMDGKAVHISNPRVGEKLGIRMIYQELNLISELSVANNIFLGHEIFKKGLPGIVDSKKMVNEAKLLLKKLKLEIDPSKTIKTLGVGEQQMVEIAKALSMDAKIVVFDEPTSSLTDLEIKELFRLISYLKEKGIGMFYISHRLEELLEIGDRVTIMRDGKVIDTKAVKDISMNELIEKIADRTIDDLYPHQKCETGELILEVNNLCGEKYKNVNINIKAGEIVGLSGLVGSGRTELARAIFGVDNYDSGEVLLKGKKVSKNNPQKCVDIGISLLPEDRKNDGLALSLSIKENIMISSLQKSFPKGFINSSQERSVVEKYVDNLQIATSTIDKITRQLSGGTQQKVVVSKWLLTNAVLFIFDEPTRGIDVGAKTEIYKIMDELVSHGAGILMISSDLPEVLGMSDRVYVMCQGRIAGEFESNKTTQKEILKYAFGQVE